MKTRTIIDQNGNVLERFTDNPQLIMSITMAFLGMPYEFALVAITVIATVITGLAMLSIVFFAWAPYVSNAWASEFGAGFEGFEEETQAGGD